MAQAATTSTVGTTAQVTGVETGKTTIVDPVVAKIAGIAAREVPGVHALGGGAARVFGNLREAVGAKDFGRLAQDDLDRAWILAVPGREGPRPGARLDLGEANRPPLRL